MSDDAPVDPSWQPPQPAPDFIWERIKQKDAEAEAKIPAPVAIARPVGLTEEQKLVRASKYLAKMQAGIAGSNGHGATFKAACAMVVGFELDTETAYRLLCNEYNPRCQPPWTEKELRHKVSQAETKSTLPRGWLLQRSSAAARTQWDQLVEGVAPAPSGELGEIVGDAAPPWQDELKTLESGALKPTLANLVHVLGNDPEWSGVLAYDLFASRLVTRKPPPFGRRLGQTELWEDVDDVSTELWFERSIYRVAKSAELIQKAVVQVARDNAYHPVREWLRSLRPWDGKHRINSWLQTVFDAEDNIYVQNVGAKFLIGAVARVMRPGCKLDTMLIVESAQGSFKSAVAKILCGNERWFTDTVGTMGSKESKEQVAGRWIIEVAELDSMRRGDVDSVKQFMRCEVDKFRPAWGRAVAEFPRQCAYFGTVNPSFNGYLRDETGNRSFWPVAQRNEVADLAWLRDNVEQLWSEAVACFDAGETWYLARDVEALARIEQAARVVHDDWDDRIAEWLIGKTEVSASEVLRQLFNVELGKQEHRMLIRVGRGLHLAGWIRVRRRIAGVLIWVYQPKAQRLLGQ